MSEKSERLFEAIGNVNDKAVDEAAQAMEKRRKPRWWLRWTAGLAAVLILAAGAGLLFLPRGGGAGGTGSNGSTFMSYAGPVMPLTLREENGDITAERDITLDFAPWGEREVESIRSFEANIRVTDSYVLTNASGREQTVSVLYPFAGDLNSRGALCPSLTLDGQPVEAALRPGRYSGGPYGLWAAWREGPWEVNLTQAENWEAYREVLSDGSYQAAALEDFPDLSGVPVVVYDFTDPWGPQPDDGSYPTIRAAFELSSGRSSVLTAGFHGMTWDHDTGMMIQSFIIPRESEKNQREIYRLVVLGEDIRDLDVRAYDTAGQEGGSVIENAGVTVTRYESDLESVFLEMMENRYDRYTAGSRADFALYYALMKDQLANYYGILDDDPAVRYANGYIPGSELNADRVTRVFYLETEVTIPAGGSVTLTAEMVKEASYDHVCSDRRNRDIYGYDLVTRLGSNLTCTRQRAALEDRGAIEIVRQNFGFDLRQGVKTVELDPAQEHYYLEVRQR